MNEIPKRRGRPRDYDPDRALEQARDVFWGAGFAASSLDDLGAAMSMNRPSLYGAFGDKEALYLKALARYRDDGQQAMRETLKPSVPLREGLRQVYEKSLDLYLAGKTGARGCFLIGTAATEAVQRETVRDMLRDSLQSFEGEFAARFRSAQKQGELDKDADPAALAMIASAILHSLAVRARAGDSRATLGKIAAAGVNMLCGNPTKTQTRRKSG